MRYEIKAEQLDKIIAKQDELIKLLKSKLPIMPDGEKQLESEIAALKQQGEPVRESLLEDIKQARNNLYNDMPTGKVSAFELTDIIRKHLGRLDIIINESAG